MATRNPPDPAPLTPRQRQVEKYLRRYLREHGFPPTLREIASELGVHPTAAAGHLASLERKGVIRRVAGVARGLVLTGGRDGR
jgi:repressor LexA